MSVFTAFHFRCRQGASTAGNHRSSTSFYRASESSDWSNERGAQSHTYLSMFGGVFDFHGSIENEFTARCKIAQDVLSNGRDWRGYPLALAECARLDQDGVAVFPFFLDADIKSAHPRTHAELVGLARDVVLPATLSHYPPDAFPDVHMLVCAARKPKDLSFWSCPSCESVLDAGSLECATCGAVFPDETTDAELRRITKTDPSAAGVGRAVLEARARTLMVPHVPRVLVWNPLFKTAVHFRTWNTQTSAPTHTLGPEERFPVVTGHQAVDVTSDIYARAIGHPVYSAWGTAAEWLEWCDVAPVVSSTPSLRVLGTVKSSKCHGCHGRKALVATCILCNGSGKVVDDRPYGVVGCLDAAGNACPVPVGTEAQHATSIRVTGDASAGFVPLVTAVPRLVALPADVERSRSLLRNPEPSVNSIMFRGLSDKDQRRLRLKPDKRKPQRPRGNYREVMCMRRVSAAQDVVHKTGAFAGHYADVVVTKVYEQPGGTQRLVVHVDGPGSTFCFNRGPSTGRLRGPGTHGSSRVWFILDPDKGVRQRCFSEKPGEAGGPCKTWAGTPWHDMGPTAMCRIWPHKRADATATTFMATSMSRQRRREDTTNATDLSRVMWRCIDHSLALDGQAQLDPHNFLACCGAMVSAEVGGVAHGQELQNRSQTMYAILRRNNLDEPDTLLPDATPTSAPSDAGSSGGAG